MSRPAPRKSSLTGSPVAPAVTAAPPTAPIEAAAPSVEPSPADATPSVSETAPKSGTKYPKVGFYQDPDRTARMRGAFRHTSLETGIPSLSKFIDEAVMEKVEELEAKYNGGKPFPRVGAREISQGRPLGE
jgi:hypothetical protein